MTRIAIDASNITSGGGLTHLVHMLGAAKPMESNVTVIHLWTSRKTAQKLPKHEWLVVHTPEWCNAGLARRIWSQQFILPVLLKKTSCDVLFSPGGTLPTWSTIPMITMSQNMLPFEPDRAALFGRTSWMRLKMRVLRISQGKSFRRAQGVIFLTEYAHKTIKTTLDSLKGSTALIPHGIEPRFVMQPRTQKTLEMFAIQPLRLLYVSIQMPYKHHLEVMQAVMQLRQKGLSIELHMVGNNTGAYGEMVRTRRLALDPDQSFLHDLGPVDFDGLHKMYRQADAFVFASSCENLPNILIEAMAAGLPIACAHRGPMPEVLGDAGVYFNPESSTSIAQAIEHLAHDADLRAHIAHSAWQRAQAYSWERCARETLNFIAEVSLKHK